MKQEPSSVTAGNPRLSCLGTMSTDRNVIRALEDAANRGLDVHVMLEPHLFGGGTSPSKTLDTLAASGIKTQFTNPSFSLTHEKEIPFLRNVSVQI
jgi:hypothetical protein